MAGFAGFSIAPDLGPDAQLLCALAADRTGRGYATEAGAALLAYAGALGWTEVTAAVVETNRASVRVLRGLGFVQTHACPGAAGRTLCFVRHLATRLPAEVVHRRLLDIQGLDMTREVFETLAAGDHARVERIVSLGQCTPEGMWYEQDEHEFVVVLEGRARLGFADGRELDLARGDSAWIPKGCKHRVSATDPGRPTVWLAVFLR